ncbi:BirA family biotin operon repressor/biotin-[acetyl-CoA-carboxylase] ligase [Halopolyspora algeriensis]|uniref:biotin--[biotin carboxyl-carrier protein] ligase n=1 Tax=Halopolyspora algeriensis TaxID=1500506 RepID=A0A368VFW5_9ACTN|nr:biotin--[acetyl-CoA-carboxylase] ligase [Halopolyspora algeriensis]RCW39170.1 BirA family biotin operon repressor/biotin-[acetyl-CoA-carboxylase] ligase [Halopolyspora algeriensis]TQM47462.1 BirA family biotin operon repressor/biotin-[acetyl-CoA-carboxylase] ligase [Halopolyspora algeriensis]
MTTTPTPLNADKLRARLVDNGPYSAVDVVPVTGSTNTDLVAEAAGGAADRTVLIAEEQQAGRGRMQRSWVSPPCYGLHMSILLRPVVARSALSWLPLVAGVALAETVGEMTDVATGLKWPNDLLLGEDRRKAAGILAEGVSTLDGMAIVLGIGVNVHHDVKDLPTGAGGLPATSLAAEGAHLDREEFAARTLESLAEAEQLWREHAGAAEGGGLLDRYRRLCDTLERQVRVEFGSGEPLSGTAADVDTSGRLVVRAATGVRTPVSAGDVVHLRPTAE